MDSNPPTLSINQPSVSETTYGPVSFQIEYQGADNITLKTSDIIETNGTLKIGHRCNRFGQEEQNGDDFQFHRLWPGSYPDYGSAYDNSNLFSAQSAKSLLIIVKAPDSDVVRPTPSGWPMKHGTEGEDKANAVATDSAGNVYGGFTEGR